MRQTVRLVIRGLIVGAGLTGASWSGAVLGQGTPTDAASADALEEVTVTGTRLRATGFDQPTPVTVASTEELLASSPMTLADGLTKLPQFVGSSSRTYCCAVGALGNFLDLRALGAARTLILLDGQRVVATRESGEIDVNLLPEMLVQSVDVVTGGASAAYGSDAVSGVVNYVIDRKLEGLKVEAQYGESTYGDDASIKAGVAGGLQFADGRGHFVGSLQYFKVDGIPSLNARPDSRRGGFLGGNGSAAAPFTSVEGVNQITATDGGVIVNAANLPVANAAAPLAGLKFLAGGATAPFVIGTPVAGSPAFAIGGDGFRNNEMQPAGLLRTDKAYALLSYDLTDAVTLSARLNAAQSYNHMRILSDNRSTAASYTIFRENAYLPAAVRTLMDTAGVTSFRLARFNRDFGTIDLDYDNRTADLALGLEGEMANDLHWNLTVSHGRTTLDAEVQNVSDLGKAYAAADAVVNPANGQIVCRVTLTNPTAFPGCVPLNPFGAGAPSDAAKDYILGASAQYVRNTQTIAAAELSGNAWELPAGAISFAAGAEYRKRTLLEESNPTALSQIQATGVRGMPGVLCPTVATCRFGAWNQGNFGEADAEDDVREAFLEFQLPLLKDAVAARSLALNAAYRYTDYQNSGGVSTWKAGLTYEPVEGLRLRATRSRDIRAPNLFELFAGPVNAFTPGLTDPETGQTNVIAITRTQGNPGLEPETADALTVGLVYSPAWLEGFTGSIDSFDIDLTGALDSTTAQGTIDECQRGIAQQCALITRDPVTRNIQQIILQQINLNGRQVRGLDLEFGYAREALGGRINVRLLGSRMFDYIDRIGSDETQFVGWYSDANDFALPKWRGNLSVNYVRGPFDLLLQERYIGSYDQMPPLPGQIFADPEIEAVLYTDVTMKYEFEAGNVSAEVFGTINNLFNRRPPFLPNRFAANLAFPTVPNLYDLDNRYYTLGARLRF